MAYTFGKILSPWLNITKNVKGIIPCLVFGAQIIYTKYYKTNIIILPASKISFKCLIILTIYIEESWEFRFHHGLTLHKCLKYILLLRHSFTDSISGESFAGKLPIASIVFMIFIKLVNSKICYYLKDIKTHLK